MDMAHGSMERGRLRGTWSGGEIIGRSRSPAKPAKARTPTPDTAIMQAVAPTTPNRLGHTTVRASDVTTPPTAKVRHCALFHASARAARARPLPDFHARASYTLRTNRISARARAHERGRDKNM